MSAASEDKRKWIRELAAQILVAYVWGHNIPNKSLSKVCVERAKEIWEASENELV